MKTSTLKNPARENRVEMQKQATHRVLLKRVIRAACGYVYLEASTENLTVQIQNLIQVAPAVVARGLESAFESAAKAWTAGNNSGDQNALVKGEEDCNRWQFAAESILTAFGVTIDYPGLYPSFNWRGVDYHDCLSLCRAIAQAKGQ